MKDHHKSAITVKGLREFQFHIHSSPCRNGLEALQNFNRILWLVVNVQGKNQKWAYRCSCTQQSCPCKITDSQLKDLSCLKHGFWSELYELRHLRWLLGTMLERSGLTSLGEIRKLTARNLGCQQYTIENRTRGSHNSRRCSRTVEFTGSATSVNYSIHSLKSIRIQNIARPMRIRNRNIDQGSESSQHYE